MRLLSGAKRQQWRNMVCLLLAQGLFVLSNLYINYKANQLWGVEAFAIYNLLKRFGAFMIYPLLVGAGIGIPRFISFLKRRREEQSVEYLWAGLLSFLILFGLFAVLLLCFPAVVQQAFGLSAKPVGGNADAATKLFWWAILGFILTQGLFVLLSAYYRGRLAFARVAILNAAILSVLPLAVLWFAVGVWDYFVYYSAASFILLLLICLLLQRGKKISRRAIRLKQQRLFRYGWPRIGAELGLFGLEFIPVFGLSLFVSLEASAYLSLTFILLKLAAMLFELAGSMVLPYFGQLYAQQPRAVFVHRVQQLLMYGALVALATAGLFYVLSPYLVRWFFPALSPAAGYAQWVFVAFPVYALYLLLRNILDIMSHRAYNTVNLLIALLLLFALLAAGICWHQVMLYQVAVVIGPYLLLGALSYQRWLKLKMP